MDHTRKKACAFLANNRDQLIEKLEDFLRIPSISTESEHRDDVQHAAQWLKDHLRNMGMTDIEIFQTPGAPVVFGSSPNTSDSTPTLLIYGHYDVQPVDPLEEWESPPFEPRRQGDCLYARGASDMKGQILAALNALQAVQTASGIAGAAFL